MARRLASVKGEKSADAPGLAAKVAETLESLELGPEDAALAQIAREYAAQVDRAAIIAAQLAKLTPSPDTEEELGRLRARVSAHQVLIDLGPKLQSALDALGATPKARSALPGKPNRGPSKLAAMRGGA